MSSFEALYGRKCNTSNGDNPTDIVVIGPVVKGWKQMVKQNLKVLTKRVNPTKREQIDNSKWESMCF
jgi:hypothetical protein